MTTKQWYRILLEDRVLMHPSAEGAPPVLLPVRVELLGPEQDWPGTWTLSSSFINSSPSRTESIESPMSLVSVRFAMLPQKICTMLSSLAPPADQLLTCYSAMYTQ